MQILDPKPNNAGGEQRRDAAEQARATADAARAASEGLRLRFEEQIEVPREVQVFLAELRAQRQKRDAG